MKQPDVYLTLTLSGARSLSRILQHNIGQAEGTAQSQYGIDTICRSDCAARWRELRSYVDQQIEVATKKQKTEA